MRETARRRRLSRKTSIEDEIAQLRDLDLKALRVRWWNAFDKPAPEHLTRYLLFRIIAYSFLVRPLIPTTREQTHQRVLLSHARYRFISSCDAIRPQLEGRLPRRPRSPFRPSPPIATKCSSLICPERVFAGHTECSSA